MPAGVVISNCVVNLLTAAERAERAERGSYAGCIAGALSKGEYETGLSAAGFEGAEVTFTQEVADGLHGAIIRAAKPHGGGEPTMSADVVTTLPMAGSGGCC
jgi:hypothetical protein